MTLSLALEFRKDENAEDFRKILTKFYISTHSSRWPLSPFLNKACQPNAFSCRWTFRFKKKWFGSQRLNSDGRKMPNGKCWCYCWNSIMKLLILHITSLNLFYYGRKQKNFDLFREHSLRMLRVQKHQKHFQPELLSVFKLVSLPNQIWFLHSRNQSPIFF